MKLASYRDGSRDGQLIVVSRDLGTAHYASGIAGRLQQVLDDWNFMSPQLEELSQTLNHGKARHAFAFDPARCMAPLPRAFRWATGAPRPAHAAGDALLGAHDAVELPAGSKAVEFGAGLAAISGDLAAGSSAEAALEGIRLLMLAVEWHLSPDDIIGAFGPVAVTPDELGAAWHGGRGHLAVEALLNGRRLDLAGSGGDTALGTRLAALCRHRAIGAGSIVGSASHVGSLAPGDTLRLEFKGGDATSLFGAILQGAVAPAGADAATEGAAA